ncbi:LAME_0A06282g1_1 [Lachancea meyersii CBS 8951]|uniref:LAME_0A06282g1_1 n=1 Tax=Lachancea meyersii CBS 8951 TaxID=1266667 RepID=A0A1G4IQM2_9SACH|nr:LAME_0A06282g1_1 [Lachancea meyersii CBS 8951]
MANSGCQVSHVQEFYCQYTDQIHKKQKAWHDGRMKFYQLNHKFQLYSMEGGMLLDSAFITNSRRVDHILDESGFNKEEHKIFGQFLVMIDCLQCEYDRDISGKVSDASTAYNVKKYTTENSGSIVESKVNCKLRPQKSGPAQHHDSLALKFNKPFRRPQIKQRNVSVHTKQQAAEALNAPAVKKIIRARPTAAENVRQKLPTSNGRVSLALDMSASRGFKKETKPNSIRSVLKKETEKCTNDSQDELNCSKLGTSFLATPQKQLQQPSVHPVASLQDPDFRVQRRDVTVKHERIVLGQLHQEKKHYKN